MHLGFSSFAGLPGVQRGLLRPQYSIQGLVTCSFITMTTEPTSPSEQVEQIEQKKLTKSKGFVVDSLTLHFDGENADGSPLHELHASHVAEVLQGLVGLTDDFDKDGVFDGEGPANSEVLVRPAKEGSFEIEVIRTVLESPTTIAGVGSVLGIPSLGVLIKWATKSARADVKHIDRRPELDLVYVTWQDDTMDEMETRVWEALNKKKRRRKKHVKQIMAAFADPRVSSLDVPVAPTIDKPAETELLVLKRADYDAVKLEDDIKESHNIFDVEAQMAAIDFDDSKKWKVKTSDQTRVVIMDDQDFLDQVEAGLAIRKEDIFNLKIRVDKKTKNGSTRTTWTVLRVLSHKGAIGVYDS